MDYPYLLHSAVHRKQLLQQGQLGQLSTLLALPDTQLIYTSHIITECINKTGHKVDKESVLTLLRVVNIVIEKVRKEGLLCQDFSSVLKACFTGLSLVYKKDAVVGKEVLSGLDVEDFLRFIEEFEIPREDLQPMMQFIINQKRMDPLFENVVEVVRYHYVALILHYTTLNSKSNDQTVSIQFQEQPFPIMNRSKS